MRPHGTKARYHSGCRCDLCREARRLEGIRDRAREGKDRLVPAAFAQRHVESLGLPERVVAQAAGLHFTALNKLVSGKRKYLRLSTVNKILAVKRENISPSLLDHFFIPADETKKLISDLRASGFTNKDIGRKLGIKQVQIELPRVRAWNAKRIENLYRTAGTAR